MSFLAKLHTKLDKILPESHYSNGDKADCILFRISCVFDPFDKDVIPKGQD